MSLAAQNPFDRDEVVRRYEDWYRTPYGLLADRIERRMLDDMLSPLPPGASVLEIGCGTGWFGVALARRGFRVAGADKSRPMLAVARSRFPVVQADAARLPFRDGAFDAAILVAVLDFVADPAAVLREARRVAREQVAVIALASRSWLALRRRVAGWRGHAVFSQVRFRSRREILDLAREAGAKPDRVRGALVLPPALAARIPRLEESLSRRAPPCAGIVGFSLPGGGRP